MSSNTGFLSNNEIPTEVTLPSDSPETEEANFQHVATLIKAFKDGTASAGSYDTILEAVMKNAKSRDALMKAVMDNTKLHGFVLLSQPVVTDFPNAIEITADHVKAAGGEPSGVEKYLTPPHGTRGFHNQIYQIHNSNWVVNVHAYRHANSSNVTLIVLHSGSVSVPINNPTAYTMRTTPASVYKFHYPVTFESEIGNNKYSYLIDYTDNLNMIGPDGKNPIVFRAIYKETFTAQIIQLDPDPANFGFVQLNGPIYGMSVINISSEVGTPIDMEFVQNRFYDGWSSSRIQFIV